MRAGAGALASGTVIAGTIEDGGDAHPDERAARRAALALSDRLDLMVLRRMIAEHEVILDRLWNGRRGGGWTVTVIPAPDEAVPLGGTWPDYQDAALYASRLSRARGLACHPPRRSAARGQLSGGQRHPQRAHAHPAIRDAGP